MKEFAKIFIDDEVGQILVFKDTDRDGVPALTFKFIVDEGTFVNYQSIYSDNDEGYRKLDHYFDKADREMAMKVVVAIKDR